MSFYRDELPWPSKIQLSSIYIYKTECVCVFVSVCVPLYKIYFIKFLKIFSRSYRKTTKECLSQNRI